MLPSLFPRATLGTNFIEGHPTTVNFGGGGSAVVAHGNEKSPFGCLDTMARLLLLHFYACCIKASFVYIMVHHRILLTLTSKGTLVNYFLNGYESLKKK